MNIVFNIQETERTTQQNFRRMNKAFCIISKPNNPKLKPPKPNFPHQPTSPPKPSGPKPPNAQPHYLPRNLQALNPYALSPYTLHPHTLHPHTLNLYTPKILQPTCFPPPAPGGNPYVTPNDFCSFHFLFHYPTITPISSQYNPYNP